MKYVALLSGGKDSCYNLLHCRKNGHDLVAAASLGPCPGTGPLISAYKWLRDLTVANACR
jgi:diphthine-ammonia ligase